MNKEENTGESQERSALLAEARKQSQYLRKINVKVQIFFWLFLAYVIFATFMLLSGKL